MMTLQELLASPDCWTQRAFARNVYGDVVSADSPTAVRWCLLGALLHCRLSEQTYQELLKKAGTGLVSFNDTHTHAEVLALVTELQL